MNWQYTLTMLIAVLAGLAASAVTQQRLRLPVKQRIALALGALCGAMIGAKLPFVLSDWDGFLSGQAWFADGKTILCGLVGGYFGVELTKWAVGINVKTGDTFAVPIPVSVGVGRLACFIGGCCYGLPTGADWGMDFGDGLLRHPTQLYEAAFHWSCAVLLAVLLQRGLFRGQLIKLYFLLYFVYRFFTEYLRPEPKLWGDLTIYQYATLVLFPLFVWLWWHDAKQLAAQEQLTAPVAVG